MAQERSIAILSREFGPDFDLLGRDRHLRLLRSLMSELSQEPYGEGLAKPFFFLTVDGRFASREYKKPIVDGVRSRRVGKDGLGFVDIGLSMRTILLPEHDFRESLARLLLEAAESFVLHARSKGLDFDSERYLKDVSSVVERYRAAPLPLEATASEIDTARFYGLPT